MGNEMMAGPLAATLRSGGQASQGARWTPVEMLEPFLLCFVENMFF